MSKEHIIYIDKLKNDNDHYENDNTITMYKHIIHIYRQTSVVRIIYINRNGHRSREVNVVRITIEKLDEY